jgi:hypothetical protein
MKKQYKTMSPEDIKKSVADGWNIHIYGTQQYIEEVSFTKSGGEQFIMAGFSFMPSNGLRQRELNSLAKRIQKLYPKIKVQK